MAWALAVGAYAVFGIFSVRLWIIDRRDYRLPNRDVLTALVLVTGLLTASTLMHSRFSEPAQHSAAHLYSAPAQYSVFSQCVEAVESAGCADPSLYSELFQFSRLLVSLAAGAAYFLVFFVLRHFNPVALGGGDVKLAPLVGVTTAWIHLDIALIVTPLALVGLTVVAVLRARREARDRIAFGPVLLGASWVGIAVGGLGFLLAGRIA